MTKRPAHNGTNTLAPDVRELLQPISHPQRPPRIYPEELVIIALSRAPPIIVVRTAGKASPCYYIGTLPGQEHVGLRKPDLVRELIPHTPVALFRARISKPPLRGIYEYTRNFDPDNPYECWYRCPGDDLLEALNNPSITPRMYALAYNWIKGLPPA